jgi:adenosine deaminase
VSSPARAGSACDDDTLTNRIAREQVPLTVCPLSNLRLCVVPDLKDHPLRRMLDAGLMATVNSDDPAYFGGYMNENFAALSLSREEMMTLARNGFRAAFCDEATKQRHLKALDAYGLSGI